MSRVTATERVQRILAVLPWIVQHQGATVEEICERFGLARKELIDDLDFVFYNVGLHPFTPDMLAEVTVEDDRVRVHLGDYFRRPLRLTHEEALTLLAAGRALSARPGTDPDGTLQRAVDKLSAALGDGAADAVDVALGEADPEVLSTARAAVAESRQLTIDYYSYGRDEPSTRTVDPYRVVAREGHWYLLAWCHKADGERLFRIDRIRSARLEATTFEPPDDEPAAWPDLSESQRTVELVAPANAAWVASTYPCDEVTELDDGRVRIVLPVTATPWLERLLLRLGPEVTATDLDTGASLAPTTGAAARRILERYERGLDAPPSL
jgi:proteasome accessory factor C